MSGASTNKILFIPSWYPNRTEQASGNFIKRLIQANSSYDNVAVLFVVPDPTIKNNSEVVVNNTDGIFEVIVYYKKVNNSLPFGIILKAKRRFKAYDIGRQEILNKWGQPQLVHVQEALPAILYAQRLKKKLGLHYIVTEHSVVRYIFATSALLFNMQRRALKAAEKIITVSNYLGEAMRNKGIKNYFIVVPNVVPLPDSLPALLPAESKKRILHISTLAEVKNVKGILRAIKQVSLNRNDFELVILCEIDNRKEEFIQYSKSLGLDESIVIFKSYIGDTGKLSELLISSNFMLMFSNYETFSVVLAESLWVGRPVITSKCGGPQEFIREDFGIVVNPGEEKELVNAINKMLDTWQLYDKEKMKEFARNNFAPTIIGEKMHLIHSEVIDSLNKH
ncbi:MAG TPA: glycosyltransferase family 4 protein [Bacteroidia bacterium]|jgi:glycosyltransferase involved in cell wall biosynthesis|nr:glycosyltransferase family 4 protein [Bacteroidia bacterium]